MGLHHGEGMRRLEPHEQLDEGTVLKPGDLILYSEDLSMPIWMTPTNNGDGIFDPIVDVQQGDIALLLYIDDKVGGKTKSQNIVVVTKNSVGWSDSYLWSRVDT